MKRIALLLLFIPLYAGAYDLGVLLDQSAGVGGIKDDSSSDYSAVLIPRFSTLLGDTGDVFVSAGLTASYEQEDFTFVTELLRSEITWRFDGLRIKAGRLSYADPLNFVVDGLFDGAQVLYDTTMGVFSAGAWYTGLLYKKTAKITMTGKDFLSYYTTLDYGDFADTYFASRRMLMALSWEHPSLAELVRLKCALTGQFDLNNYDDTPYTPYHSQYATLKAGIPVQRLVFELGGAIQIAQTDDDVGVGLAGELGVSWAPPAAFQSQFSLNGRFTSGNAESGSVVAFVPVTTKDQGNVLKARLSGISAISADYTARFHRSFSSSLSASYFVRSDLGTYAGYPASAATENGYLLGGELFARLIWSPASDVRLNAGGGFFLPSLGNVAPDADPQWRIELGLVLALY
jgi:hypothetical protein